MLLEDGTPMLLEVNSNPSVSIMFEKEISPGKTEMIPSLIDEQIKRPLVRDTFMLVAPKGACR